MRLGRKVVSTDERIVETAGKRIPDIVEEKGWDGFRDIETAVIGEVAGNDGLIVDAGGGVVVRDKNIELLRSNGMLFWLTAEVKTIADRIHRDTERPSLTCDKSFIDEIKEVLTVRTPLYTKAAHHVINTEGRTPDEVADLVMEKWNAREDA